jgi:mycofactocin biosynthesis protein MftB
MACAVSTELPAPGQLATGLPAPGLPAAGAPAEFDLDRSWQLHPQVSVRPEHFGALMYHFGTRRLSFLKSPVLLTVVRALDTAPSARVACATAGVAAGELAAYAAALATLARTQMIRERPAAGDPGPHPAGPHPAGPDPVTREESAS